MQRRPNAHQLLRHHTSPASPHSRAIPSSAARGARRRPSKPQRQQIGRSPPVLTGECVGAAMR